MSEGKGSPNQIMTWQVISDAMLEISLSRKSQSVNNSLLGQMKQMQFDTVKIRNCSSQNTNVLKRTWELRIHLHDREGMETATLVVISLIQTCQLLSIDSINL